MLLHDVLKIKLKVKIKFVRDLDKLMFNHVSEQKKRQRVLY